MKFNELRQLFYEWGWKIDHINYVQFCEYLQGMLKRNRVMVVEGVTGIEAVLMFYLTDDYTKVYKKSTWQLVSDVTLGSKMFIDKIICKKFTCQLHRDIVEAVSEKFSQVKEIMYLRYPRDRRVIIKVRRKLCPTR